MTKKTRSYYDPNHQANYNAKRKQVAQIRLIENSDQYLQLLAAIETIQRAEGYQHNSDVLINATLRWAEQIKKNKSKKLNLIVDMVRTMQYNNLKLNKYTNKTEFQNENIN